MSKAIFRLDDGSTYYFDADTPADARRQWLALLVEDSEGTEADILEANILESGEPAITRVKLTEAARIEVTDEANPAMVRCDHCGGRGEVVKPRNLLEVWQDEQKLPQEKRAHQGALCNSEWP